MLMTAAEQGVHEGSVGCMGSFGNRRRVLAGSGSSPWGLRKGNSSP